VVLGEADRVVPPELGRRLAREIEGARTVEIASAGHAPHEERPEAFLGAVLPFLSED
jgi:pimeloyl-ACP methyl ester carboxylesterase